MSSLKPDPGLTSFLTCCQCLRVDSERESEQSGQQSPLLTRHESLNCCDGRRAISLSSPSDLVSRHPGLPLGSELPTPILLRAGSCVTAGSCSRTQKLEPLGPPHRPPTQLSCVTLELYDDCSLLLLQTAHESGSPGPSAYMTSKVLLALRHAH